MQRIMTVLALGLLIGIATIISANQTATKSYAGENASAQANSVRIGTYDNRAIAIAFAGSKHNPVNAKMAEYKKAKSEGDDAKAKELEDWGKSKQRMLHFQGFGHVPVDDLLAPVKAQLADVAKAKGLSAIVMDCDFAGEGVEVIDVTKDIVALYAPNDRTLNFVDSIKDKEPLDLLTLADMPVDK